MNNNQIEIYSEVIFEDIKHVNEYGQEFWYARELQEVLGYSQWRGFKEVIEKAMKGEAVPYAFIAKMILTAITIEAGFKGGEIVPSFFRV